MIELTNLLTRPDKFKDTMTLIESEFGYDEVNSFEKDFLPLIKKENHKNLYILMENETVIGHIGLLEKDLTINNNDYKCAFLGGIVIKSSHQGRGLSKRLMSVIDDKINDYTFILLWSDKTDYYKKFDYSPCIQQFQYEHSPSKSLYERIEDKDEFIDALKHLYIGEKEVRPQRDESDWNTLKEMNSVDLYIKRNDEKEIINYFLINKGQDLQSIIHEYATVDSDMLNYGYLWTPHEIQGLAPLYQYGALLKIGSESNFKSFIHDITDKKIQISAIDSHSVEFQFNNKSFQLSIDEFLTGVLGPSRFEELEDCPYLYIPGIDSI